jgi:hypothetical protein
MRGWSLTYAWVAILMTLLAVPLSRAEQTDLEYKVKAAFLLNFAKFTAWPETSTSKGNDFALCVVGEDPFGAALSGVEEKQIEGKRISLRHPAPTGEGLGQCRMLYVSKSEQANLGRIFKSIVGQPVVTISDIEGFAAAGGIFEFKDRDGRLSFVINNNKAKAGGIQISSSLLNLALEVL